MHTGRLLVVVALWSSSLLAKSPAPEPEAAEPPADVAAEDVDATDDSEPLRAITLLPLVPGRTVTSKQAKGITARVREALVAVAEEGAVRLLPETRDDDKVVRRCAADVDCYRDVAKARGADRLGFGTVEVEEGGGLRVTLQLTSSSSTAHTAVFAGERTDDLTRFDRLAREAFAEESLRGDLVLEGQPGDAVFVDGRRRGTIDASKQYQQPRLREGKHQVEVRRTAGQHGTRYEPFTREVTITHRETTTVKALLLPLESTAALATEPDAASSGPPLGPVVTGGAGAALLVAGGVFGVLALTTSTEVEERAEQQQLVFPRDSGLVQQGRTFALVSTITLAAGVLGAGGGVAWWFLTPAPTEDVDDAATVGGAR
jgi:hypothetical protein